MDYAAALRNHLPIGTGSVEAICKTLVSLVSVGMRRAGSRWKPETGEQLIRLRAVALNDYWGDAMQRLHAKRRRSVRSGGRRESLNEDRFGPVTEEIRSALAAVPDGSALAELLRFSLRCPDLASFAARVRS